MLFHKTVIPFKLCGFGGLGGLGSLGDPAKYRTYLYALVVLHYNTEKSDSQ